MILKNYKSTTPKPFKIPENLQGKITLLANCDLTADEIDLFNSGLSAISCYIIDQHIDLSDYSSCNVFFTYDGSFTVEEEKTTNCGAQFHIAPYRMEPLRYLNSVKIMLFVFVEELAHYFLRISDETIIKYKVAEILRYVLPSFTIEEVKGYGLNGLEK